MNYHFKPHRQLFPVLIVVILTLLLTGSCQEIEKEQSAGMEYFIPDNAIAVMSGDKLNQHLANLADNSVFKDYSKLSNLVEIQKTASFLQYINLESEAILCLSQEGKGKPVITSITAIDRELLPPNDAGIIDYDGESITRYNENGIEFYTVNLKQIQIASTSKLIVESLVRRQKADTETNVKLVELMSQSSSSDPYIYLRTGQGSVINEVLFQGIKYNVTDADNWFQLEMEKKIKLMELHGIVTVSENQEVFHKVSPAKNSGLEVAPTTLDYFTSVSFEDGEAYWEAMNLSVQDEKRMSGQKKLVTSADDISFVRSGSKRAMAIHTKEYGQLSGYLDSLTESERIYRGVKIHALQKEFKSTILSPFLPSSTYTHGLELGNHLIFTNTGAAAEHLIVNHNSGAVIANQSWFLRAAEQLNEESHFLEITRIANLIKTLNGNNKSDATVLYKVDDSDHRYAISQSTTEVKYAYVNFLIPNSTVDQESVAQTASYRSEKDIIAGQISISQSPEW